MKFYSLQFGLSEEISQTQLIDQLRSGGAEVIQTSSGLCVKTEISQAEIQKLAGAKVRIKMLDASRVAKDESIGPDVKAFIAGAE